jgi:hypothetical protein
MKNRTFISLGLAMWLVLLSMQLLVAAPAESVVFFDDFNGPALNPV